MQINLHSKRRRIRFGICMILVAAIVIVLFAVTVKRSDNTEKTAVNKEKTMYLSVFSPAARQPEITKEVRAEEKMPKMNNEIPKNSNIDASQDVPIENSPVSCKNVRLRLESGKILNLPLEEYVVGCVLGEMPTSFAPQALMAQAVAVRSITVRKTMSSHPSHRDADVCADYNCCQNYISPDDKRFSETQLQKVIDAVNATRGIIAVFDGAPIEAVYHASSGYSTLSSKDVWGGDVPYLSATDSPVGEKDVSAKNYSFSYSDLSGRLCTVSETVQSVGAFGNDLSLSLKDNNLVKTVKVGETSFDAKTVRRALGLSSSDFEIVKRDDGIDVVSYGYGHRVGMSQHGANILANEGKSYIEILKYYYKGISLSFLNEK